MSKNLVILIGNLGKDPELRYTPSGTAVATFSVATSETTFKDREGNKQTKTEWHNIVVWRQLAEICGKYLHKGKQVYLEGKIQNRSYDDRDGNKRYISEIIANEMQMLGSKSDEQRNQNQQQNSQQQNNQKQPGPREQQYQTQQRQGVGTNEQQGFAEPTFTPEGDEIPF